VKPIVIRRERMVAIPADVVWEFIEPVERLASWLPFVTASRHLSGKGLGRRQRVRLSWAAAEVVQEVTIYAPGKTLAWRHVASGDSHTPPGESKPVDDISVMAEMESTGPGTRVVLAARITPKSLTEGLRHRLKTARRIRAGFDRALRNLASVGD
jgi:uncharacterized protein YndB with AHSA1/START domain